MFVSEIFPRFPCSSRKSSHRGIGRSLRIAIIGNNLLVCWIMSSPPSSSSSSSYFSYNTKDMYKSSNVDAVPKYLKELLSIHVNYCICILSAGEDLNQCSQYVPHPVISLVSKRWSFIYNIDILYIISIDILYMIIYAEVEEVQSNVM